jgi:16S rRNA (cytosine1402-N4)-methyltransferase
MHIPVLKKEVIRSLNPKPNENFVDCTFGEGGHAIEILKRTSPHGKLLAIEIDPELYKKGEKLKEKFGERLILVNDSFENLEKIVKERGFKDIHGILLDLGMSSWHLEESKRGFSFQRDEPLIMRYDWQKDKNSILTAKEILNKWPGKDIEKILKEYGEERFAKKIVKEILETRRKKEIATTKDLVEIIKKATPKWYQRRKIHFATKTFLALRVFINQELERLKKVLPQTIEVLKKGGRVAIISFHSLEDKIVKSFLKEMEEKKLAKIITKKAIKPSLEEIKQNPRSRSAKLRVAEKI